MGLMVMVIAIQVHY